MKKRLTITGMFNDAFTNYEDKMSNITMVVDPEEDCECTSYKVCVTCKLIAQGVLTDIE